MPCCGHSSCDADVGMYCSVSAASEEEPGLNGGGSVGVGKGRAVSGAVSP